MVWVDYVSLSRGPDTFKRGSYDEEVRVGEDIEYQTGFMAWFLKMA